MAMNGFSVIQIDNVPDKQTIGSASAINKRLLWKIAYNNEKKNIECQRQQQLQNYLLVYCILPTRRFSSTK